MTTPTLTILIATLLLCALLFLGAERWSDERKERKNREAVDRFLDRREL